MCLSAENKLPKKIYTRDSETVAAGKEKGRTSDEEITLFDSTGLAIQDVSCAYTVYKALKDKPGITRIELF